MGTMEARVIPQGHEPTDLQREIIKLLDIADIPWIFEDTAGGCNCLSVTDASGTRQVCVTNIDDAPGAVFALVEGGEECAMLGTQEERWASVVFTSDDPYDFINIARFLCDDLSDPYDHVLSDGTLVVRLFV